MNILKAAVESIAERIHPSDPSAKATTSSVEMFREALMCVRRSLSPSGEVREANGSCFMFKSYIYKLAELIADLFLMVLSGLALITTCAFESFTTTLRLSIGGDITRVPGLQIPLSLVEPTACLQVRWI
jgi:hypothetical protein